MAERPSVAAGAREEADRVIREESARILGVLQALHDDPELSGEERRASLRLGQELASEGFEIEQGAGGMPTAFVARTVNVYAVPLLRPETVIGLVAPEADWPPLETAV